MREHCRIVRPQSWPCRSISLSLCRWMRMSRRRIRHSFFEFCEKDCVELRFDSSAERRRETRDEMREKGLSAIYSNQLKYLFYTLKRRIHLLTHSSNRLPCIYKLHTRELHHLAFLCLDSRPSHLQLLSPTQDESSKS